jgi:retron-type reverse transcriptase
LKRYGNLFEKAFSKENLYSAYLDARKGKRKKKACFEFEINLGANLNSLYDRIHNGSYKPDPYFKFVVYEPKERIIHAPSFRDIVVQHAIYRTVYDIFDRGFINTSFACRKGYGTHKASDYTQRVLRCCDDNEYTLKLDIRKFFHSVDRDILRQLIARKIKDNRMLDIMMLFTKKDGSTGIPIGNLLSQIYATIYLSPLDHYIKRNFKVKYYVRYVDDFVLFGLTRDECLRYRVQIIGLIKERLKLELSKSTIQKVKRGVNFVGYRTWKTKRLIRKYSLYKFSKKVKNNQQESIMSLLGHAKQTDSLPYMLSIIKESNKNGQNIQIPKNYRPLYNSLYCRA